jgi:transposase-like protein
MTKRKQFSAEFKREAVRLLETSKKQPSESCPGTWGSSQSTLQVERSTQPKWQAGFSTEGTPTREQ